MMSEMKRSYTPAELSFILLNKREHQLKMAFDSFKIVHNVTSFERFTELCGNEDLPKICLLINELEGNISEGEEKKKMMKEHR